MNMVDCFFRAITDKRSRRDSFTRVVELKLVIDRHVAPHNIEPKSFIWTASANEILPRSLVLRPPWQLPQTKHRTERRTAPGLASIDADRNCATVSLYASNRSARTGLSKLRLVF
jgi:hypothetical protein